MLFSTKALLKKLRVEDWEDFVAEGLLFCTKHGILMPDMSALEHHYHFDVSVRAIEYQVKELKSRINDEAIKLLTPTSTVDLTIVLNHLTLVIFFALQKYFIFVMTLQ